MAEEAGIFFGAIAGRTRDFYRRYRKAESYKRLTKDTVLAAFDAHLAPDAPDRRKLSVRVASRKHAATVAEGKDSGDRSVGGLLSLRSLEDIRAFKDRTPTYE